MKKLGVIIIALLFAGLGTVNAQQHKNVPAHNYFTQTVLPFIEQQQKNLELALTNSERATLKEIRQEMVAFREQGVQMRKSMQGKFNPQARENRKAQFEAIVAKARKLVNAHPQAAATYKKAIENELAKWKEHMMGMNRGNGNYNGRGQRMNFASRPGLQRLSDPAVGLLMDARVMRNRMMHKAWDMKAGYGMRGNQGRMGRYAMEHRNGFPRAAMMAMHNPQVRAQIKAYVQKNVLPVIRTERELFDKYLSKKEKKAIANARATMQAQRERMMQMRKSGAKPSDSARLATQLKMEENRIAMQQIVLKHYGELQKVMAPIKEKIPQWRNGIRKIIIQQIVEQQMKQAPKKFGAAKAMLKEKGDIRFLLFDPLHPENNGFMQPFNGFGRK